MSTEGGKQVGAGASFSCGPINLATVPFVLGPILSVLSLALLGCGPSGRVSNVRLNQEAETYQSAMRTRESVVEVQKVADGLRCVVAANPDPTRTHSGGVMIPLGGAKACRMEIGFKDPESIVVAYVDAFNAKKKRVGRWRTEQWAALPRERRSYLFEPPENAKDFKFERAEGTGAIETLHVSVDVKPGSGAVFEVGKVEAIK